ncbi:MAG: S41 family peptidase [Planctomycetota bacterium]
MPPRHLNFILITITACLACYFTHRRIRSALSVADAINLIEREYVDPVERKDLVKAAMSGLTEGLDPYSAFISADDYNDFQSSIEQEFAGIGIIVDQPEEDRPVRVVTPLIGSPAIQAGLLPEDRIVDVDGEDVRTMGLSDVSLRLRGPIGTSVTIGLRRGEDVLSKTVVRDSIQLESVVGNHRNEKNEWVFRLQDQPEIAYLRVSQFGQRTTDEMRQVFEDLDNDFDSLILDLRGNGGGLLFSAVDVVDMFLNNGVVVTTRMRGGVEADRFTAEQGTLVDLDKPVVLLINGLSASASEIVAAALKDHDRATIVGSRSFGKGTVQNVIPLDYGRSALKLTVAKYVRPNEQNIHRDADAKEEDEWGVKPSEGGEITLSENEIRGLLIDWQRASYPNMAIPKLADTEDNPAIENDSEQEPAGVPVDPDQSAESSIEDDYDPQKPFVDRQMQRAIELLSSPKSTSQVAA